jgi:hypothetical protein
MWPRPRRGRWDAEQLARFLDATAGDPPGPVWRLAALTGCRRGEATKAFTRTPAMRLVEHGKLDLNARRPNGRRGLGSPFGATEVLSHVAEKG